MLPSPLTDRESSPEALAQGFAMFTAAAEALQDSYAQLKNNVVALRRQLDEAHQELQRERDAARHWQALADVSRVLAHELRNPLGSLELLAGLLSSSSDLCPQDRQSVSRMQAGIRLLTATLNNIVHFHNTQPAQTTAVDLAELIRQTADFLRPAAEQAKVELGFIDRLRQARVAADPYRLQQVLLNLALNALRVMPDGGKLYFAGKFVNRDEVRVAVIDSGPGVPPALRDRLFEPGITSRPGGLGLGLAVARAITQQHGGSLRLMNTRKGAGFEICLKPL